MENNVSTTSTGIRYGLIGGLVIIIFSLITSMAMDIETSQKINWLMYIFLAAIIFLAHKYFKDNGDGFMSFGQGLGIGTITSAIAGVLTAIYSYIYMTFVDPTLMDQIMDLQRQGMEDQGMSEAQIDQALEMTSGFMTPGMMVGMTILGMIIFGFILSLIVSAITKKVDDSEEY